MERIISRPRRCDITFRRDGRILITAGVARCLRLSGGDGLNIALRDGEWLLCASRGGRGRMIACCHPSHRGGRHLYAHSVALCRAVLSAAGVRRGRASFFTGEAVEEGGETYLPLIIKNPLP